MGFKSLEYPIDAMYLIHKALRADASRTKRVAGELEVGGSLQGFKLAFNSWVSALMFHIEQEDAFISPQLVDMRLPDRGESGRPDGRALLARATLHVEHDELLEAV